MFVWAAPAYDFRRAAVRPRASSSFNSLIYVKSPAMGRRLPQPHGAAEMLALGPNGRSLLGGRSREIQGMLHGADESGQAVVCVIDDDEDVRAALDGLLRSAGYPTRTFASPAEFLGCGCEAACLVLDVHLQTADGLAFQQELLESEANIPVVLMTGYGDIPMSVRAMKAGAVDFLTKPFSDVDMIAAVREAVERSARDRREAQARKSVRACFDSLTAREREVLSLVAAGLMNKQVGARLGVSELTVKIHRGNLMRKMQAQSLADLVRMAEALGVREISVSRYSPPG